MSVIRSVSGLFGLPVAWHGCIDQLFVLRGPQCMGTRFWFRVGPLFLISLHMIHELYQ